MKPLNCPPFVVAITAMGDFTRIEFFSHGDGAAGINSFYIFNTINAVERAMRNITIIEIKMVITSRY